MARERKKRTERRDWKSVQEANAAGVFSGMLANGDTFGDEDDGPEGGFSVFDTHPGAQQEDGDELS
mgnify:CR=1 FL=1